MKLSLIVNVLEELFPYNNALKDDRVGLQINCGDSDINSIHIAYELNTLVVEECISKESKLLVVFHPLIYRLLPSIDIEDRVGELIIKLIQNNISLFVVHTIYDTNPMGTNFLIAQRLALKKISNLIDISSDSNIGMGFVGEFENHKSLNEILKLCKNIFKSPIRYTNGKNDLIKKIAIVGGSGSSFSDKVFEQDIDAFITADNSYHSFHRFQNKIALIDPGHYEMEQFVIDGIYEYLSHNIVSNDLIFTKSSINTNPINYYIEN